MRLIREPSLMHGITHPSPVKASFVSTFVAFLRIQPKAKADFAMEE